MILTLAWGAEILVRRGKFKISAQGSPPCGTRLRRWPWPFIAKAAVATLFGATSRRGLLAMAEKDGLWPARSAA